MPKVNRKRLVLGITGGIATGKTTVTTLLRKAGIPTICSDDIAHRAIYKGTSVYKAVIRRFGTGLLQKNGQISRKHLGGIVFRDPVQRKWLESQIHPVVVRELKRFIHEHPGTVALDIPLLFEAGLEKLVDHVIVVYATKSQQLARLLKRNHLTRREALQRINAQMPLSTKCRRADTVLRNDRTLAHLNQQLSEVLKARLKKILFRRSMRRL